MKMRSILFFVFTPFLLVSIFEAGAISSLQDDKGGNRTVKGNGYTLLQRRDVGEFSRVEIRGTLSLYISQGDTMPITINADDNLFDYIVTEVQGDVLHIYVVEGVLLEHSKGSCIMLSLPRLESIVALDGAKVHGASVIMGESLSLCADRAGRVELAVDYGTIDLSCGEASFIKLKGKVDSLFLKKIDLGELKIDKLRVGKSLDN